MNASSDRLLRRTLWGNAVFSVDLRRRAGGLCRAVRPGRRRTRRSRWRASSFAIVFELLGLGVVAVRRDLRLGRLARDPAARPGRARSSPPMSPGSRAARWCWLLPAAWTTIGIAGIVVVALIVADIAVLEYLGLRRLGTAT